MTLRGRIGTESLERANSFEEFYRREYRAVLAYARAMTGDLGSAEEVTQDAFASAFGQWDRLDHPGFWIRRVVANRAKSLWRRRRAGTSAMARLQSMRILDSEIPESTADFWEEVRRLPRRQAEAVILHYLEDRPISEIARVIGCAESTARVHLMNGRRTLAQRLELEE